MQDQDKIMDKLKEYNGDYGRVARELHIEIDNIRAIEVQRTGKYGYTSEGRGRPELQKYIVSIINVRGEWNNDDPAIKAARAQYDAGNAESVIGRDGMNLILYSIPRKTHNIKHKPYFSVIEKEQANESV